MLYLHDFKMFNESKEQSFEKVIYYTTLHGSDFSNSLYEGDDYEEALYYAEDYNPVTDGMVNRTDLSIAISKITYALKFLLDDEDVEDYPVDDFWDDDSVYEIIDEDHDDIKVIPLENINAKSDELLDAVQLYFYKKYGSFKYNTIFKNDSKIVLRIADHTENIFNNDRYSGADYYISVVITNHDVTKNRFGMTNSFERRSNEYLLEYTSDNNFDEIIQEIEGLVDDIAD